MPKPLSRDSGEKYALGIRNVRGMAQDHDGSIWFSEHGLRTGNDDAVGVDDPRERLEIVDILVSNGGEGDSR